MSLSRYRNLRSTLIVAVVFLVCITAVSLTVSELMANRECITGIFKKQQELLVKQTANQAREILADKGTENDVIEEVIKQAETSGNRFWFFVKGNRFLFLKNSYELEQLRGKGANKLLDSFKADKGYNYSELYSFSDKKKSGSVLFSPSKDEEKILASCQYFEVNGTEYVIGMCTTEDYIISAGEIFRHNTYLIIVIVTICLVLISFVIVGSVTINRLRMEIVVYKKNIHAKNFRIQQLTESSIKPDMMFNKKTGLYGKRVFFSLLEKADRPGLAPVSILVFKPEYHENIAFDDLLSELSPVMRKVLPQNSIAAKAEENVLAILLIKTEHEAAKEYHAKLLRKWSGLLKKLRSGLNSDFYTQSEKDSPLQAYQICLDKLNSETRRR